MAEDPSNGELGRQIEALSKLTEKGFLDVHHRQDVTNGKVIKGEEFRIKMEANFATFKWLFGTLGLGNVVLIIKVIFDVLT